MSDKLKLIVRTILAIIGLIMLLIAVVGGATIIYLSFKFFGADWLPWWQYILVMLAYAIGLATVAFIGMIMLYIISE